LLKLRGQLDQVGRVDGAEQRAIELGDQLIGLFAAILRIAEVEGGGLAQSFAMIDLSSLAEDVADSFRPALTDSGHALTWDIDPAIVVHGNRELLAQAITNLLDNARVHTPTGTSVTLSLDAGSDWVRLTVADDGPGVARADRAAILQRFYRTEASRTTPGNGLGLSLVGAVAAAHGGSVMIDDNRPGLVITIILPRAT
jgi:signal transduction histidine kinase